MHRSFHFYVSWKGRRFSSGAERPPEKKVPLTPPGDSYTLFPIVAALLSQLVMSHLFRSFLYGSGVLFPCPLHLSSGNGKEVKELNPVRELFALFVHCSRVSAPRLLGNRSMPPSTHGCQRTPPTSAGCAEPSGRVSKLLIGGYSIGQYEPSSTPNAFNCQVCACVKS